MAEEKRYDPVSGQYTTGHNFDGIEELNNPIPKWWWWTLAITIVYSIGYIIVYPSIPLGTEYVKGTFNWTSRQQVEIDLAKARESQNVYQEQLKTATFEQIVETPDLRSFALTGGKAAFVDNCAPCHAQGGAGIEGLYPTLADDDWLWGGSFDSILTTLQHGIRANDEDTRASSMPAFGTDELLEPDQINDVAHYVLSLSGTQSQDVTASELARGAEIYATQCVSCHMAEGAGSQEFGAPRLNDQIWFYGGDFASVRSQINAPKHGVMPAWGERFEASTLKMLTIYVHSLGGGE